MNTEKHPLLKEVVELEIELLRGLKDDHTSLNSRHESYCLIRKTRETTLVDLFGRAALFTTGKI